MDKLLVIQVQPCEMYMDDKGNTWHLSLLRSNHRCHVCNESVAKTTAYESRREYVAMFIHKDCMEIVVPIKMFSAYREKLRRDGDNSETQQG